MKPLLDGNLDNALVSIIVPCYNAERWIAAAIQSCIDQTYRPIEIIVINDGSTDDSLAIIKGFGDAVRWETGPNRGGNAARNRGIALSRGEYVQFLDADDYLLPNKIERDVQFINEMAVDIVYSDFYLHQYALGGSMEVARQELRITGAKEDVLETILSDWGAAVHTLFFRRAVLANSNGWDERVRAVQERDLLITLLLDGATIAYHAGAYCVHRRYGPVTVSTSDPRKLTLNFYAITVKAETALANAGKLIPRYSRALAHSYFVLAQRFYHSDRIHSKQLHRKVLAMSPNFRPRSSRLYTILYTTLGFVLAEQAMRVLRAMKQNVYSILPQKKV